MNYPVSSTNALPRNNKMEMKEEFVKNKQTNKTRDQPMPMYGLISVLF